MPHGIEKLQVVLRGQKLVQEARVALETVFSDARLRARLSAGALRVAQQRSWDDVARETMAIYHQAVCEADSR